jgi:hypothetical protein
LSTKSEQLEWRREKVLELKSQGMNHSEIARKLQISRTCVVTDVQYLRNKAKESIKEYLTERLPEQYSICLTALDNILKNAYEILQQARDNREKIAALELYMNTHMKKLELLSGSVAIDHALRYVEQKQQHEQQQQHQQEQQSEETEEEEQEEDQEPEHTNTNTAAATGTGKHTVF